MLEEMDLDVIKEEIALVPGGDIRQRGNRWLRRAFQKASIERVPREAQFRKIVKTIADMHKLCPWVECTFLFTPGSEIELLA